MSTLCPPAHPATRSHYVLGFNRQSCERHLFIMLFTGRKFIKHAKNFTRRASLSKTLRSTNWVLPEFGCFPQGTRSAGLRTREKETTWRWRVVLVPSPHILAIRIFSKLYFLIYCLCVAFLGETGLAYRGRSDAGACHDFIYKEQGGGWRRGGEDAWNPEPGGCYPSILQEIAVVCIMWVVWSSCAVNTFPQALFMLEF